MQWILRAHKPTPQFIPQRTTKNGQVNAMIQTRDDKPEKKRNRADTAYCFSQAYYHGSAQFLPALGVRFWSSAATESVQATSLPTPTYHPFSKFGRAVAYFCHLGVLALEFFLHGCLWFWIQNTGRNEYLEIAKSKIGCYHGVCGFGFRIPAKSCSFNGRGHVVLN